MTRGRWWGTDKTNDAALRRKALVWFMVVSEIYADKTDDYLLNTVDAHRRPDLFRALHADEMMTRLVYRSVQATTVAGCIGTVTNAAATQTAVTIKASAGKAVGLKIFGGAMLGATGLCGVAIGATAFGFVRNWCVLRARAPDAFSRSIFNQDAFLFYMLREHGDCHSFDPNLTAEELYAGGWNIPESINNPFYGCLAEFARALYTPEDFLTMRTHFQV